MGRHFIRLLVMLMIAGALQAITPAQTDDEQREPGRVQRIQLGPRPLFLIDEMADSPLRRRLAACENGPNAPTAFSIGHRGAAMQFPEHTRESYLAAARMGAGIIECDVVFTRDRALVCRHAQDDLAVTTNILVTRLAAACVQPFVPATFNADGTLATPARARCRASDITLAEFKTLRGTMDGSNPRALTPEEFLQGTPRWRTDLYAGPTSGTLLTHRESIELFQSLDVAMTPELKTPSVPMPFNGFTHDQLRQKLIDEYVSADVRPGQVWPQSFDRADVLYWIENEPRFGKQAVLLLDAGTTADLPRASELADYTSAGVNIVAPPIFALLDLDGRNAIVASDFARDVKAAGLDIIPWTLERSGVLADGGGGFYYQTIEPALAREGDVYRVLDVLAQKVGIIGIFSDWPATVTYYANCLGL